MGQLDELTTLLENFYKLTETLTDQSNVIKVIHGDLLEIMRDTFRFMSQVPTLLNTLITMLTNERLDYTEYSKELEEVKKQVDCIYKFMQESKHKMTPIEEAEDASSTNT